MKEILLINPKRRTKKRRAKKATTRKPKRTVRKRVTKRATTRRAAPKKRAAPARKRTVKKGVSTMARKKGKKRAAPKKRRAPRRNPSPRARKAIRRARSSFAGLNIKGALKDIPAFQLGMFATKWLAKRFGPDATEIDPESWDWSSYIKGGIGAVLAGFLAQNVKPGWGQKVMSGGLNLIVYKMIQNELIAGNAWAADQFGAQSEYQSDYLPGDVEQDASGESYLLGQDYQWHQLPEQGVMGDVLEPVGPLGGTGEQLLPVGPLGDLDERYRQTLLGN